MLIYFVCGVIWGAFIMHFASLRAYKLAREALLQQCLESVKLSFNNGLELGKIFRYQPQPMTEEQWQQDFLKGITN